MTTVPPHVGEPQPPSDPAPWTTPGAPPSTPAGTGGSRRWLAAGAAGVAVVVGIIVVNGGDDAASTPVDAVQAHVDAYMDGNWEQAYELLCADHREEYDDAADYGASMEHSYGGALRKVTVPGTGERDGEAFDVDVTIHTVFGDDDITLEVVRESGGYRICDNLLG